MLVSRDHPQFSGRIFFLRVVEHRAGERWVFWCNSRASELMKADTFFREEDIDRIWSVE